MSRTTGAPHEVARSAPFQLAARMGLVAYGVVHLLVAWLAVQVAVGDGAGKADKTGALQSIAANPAGDALLWLIAVGLGVSALWQLLEAVSNEGATRAMNIGEAVLFGYLSFSAGKLAAGSPASSTDEAQLGLVGTLLSQPWGKPVVVVIGLAVVAAGLFLARYGITRRFAREQDISGPHRSSVLRLGQIGYVALGTTYGIAGALVVVAAVRSDPAKATGLDVALRTLAAQQYGPVLLVLIAIGLAAFAVFTFFDARHRRTS